MSSESSGGDLLDRLARGLVPQVEGMGGAPLRELIESRLFASSGKPLLGRFMLERLLGSGGMGMVYLARDPELDRQVAIKVLHGEVEHADLESIREEAAGLARLSHPNVVTVHEIGSHEGRLFLVMEYVAGSTIDVYCAELLARQGLRERRALRAVLDVFLQAGRGLAAVHQAGMIHRDFKPGNVLVGADERARVTDFGLARVMAAQGGDTCDDLTDPADVLATTVAGTLPYMAPEQLRGETLDARADVFGFCAALYETLAGVAPFPVEARAAREAAIEAGRIAAPLDRKLPFRLEAILRRGLAAAREDRWQGMEPLIEALERIQRGHRYAVPVAAGSVALSGVAAVLVLHQAGDPCEQADKAIEEVWNEDVRGHLKAAFGRVDRPYAETAHAMVRERLDSYVEGWVGMSVENCRATLTRGVQSDQLMDRRTLCLDRRLEALRSSVEFLLDADATVVREALKVAEGLPDVQPCADVERLLAAPRPSPEEIEANRALDAARALWLANRFDEAERAVAPIRENAGGVPGVRGALSLLASRIHFARGRFEEARAELEAALNAAAEAGDDALIAEIQTALLFQSGQRAQRVEVLDALALTARASVVRAGSPPRIAAILEGSLATALSRQGKLEAAIEADLAALRIIEEHDLGPRHEGLIWLHLAQTYLQKVAFHEARSSLDRARELLGRALGPGHPTLLALDNTEGDIAFQTGDYVTAREAYSRAAAGLEAELGREHPRTMATLARLASAFEAQERFEDALELQREVVEHERRTHGEEDPAHAAALSGLGLMLQASGHPSRAVEVSRRVLAIEEIHKGSEHIDVAVARLRLACALTGAGAPDEAREYLSLVLPRVSALLGSEDPIVAETHDEMARSFLAEKRLDEAAREVDLSAGILEKHPSLRSIEVIEHRLLVGDLALARGETTRALEAYGRARAVAVEVIGPSSSRALRALLGTGRAHAMAGDREAAAKAFEAASLRHDPLQHAELAIEAQVALAEVIESSDAGRASRLRHSARRACVAHSEADVCVALSRSSM